MNLTSDCLSLRDLRMVEFRQFLFFVFDARHARHCGQRRKRVVGYGHGEVIYLMIDSTSDDVHYNVKKTSDAHLR